MDMQTVMKSLEEASKDKKVKFISDKGKNSCDKCLQYDGKIFNVDDPNLPQLPIQIADVIMKLFQEKRLRKKKYLLLFLKNHYI